MFARVKGEGKRMMDGWQTVIPTSMDVRYMTSTLVAAEIGSQGTMTE
jgi:hypothetical protein